jgi:Acetyltransferase (GNAT) domain
MALTLVSPRYASPRALPRLALQQNTEGPIFHQSWWLNASGGDALEQVTTTWDGKVVGSLAFVRRRKFGFRVLNMPPYCHTQGPMLSLPAAKSAKTARNLRRVVKELMDQLPAHDRLHLILDPADKSAFAFAMAGCSVHQDFTFRLDANQNLDDHWENLDQKTRNLVRTAGKALQVRQNANLEGFLAMCEKERGGKNTHDMAALRRMGTAVLTRGQGMILTAEDARGRAAASAFLVWDDALVYYWQSSRDPETTLPGANNLLVWESMKFALENGRTFDMDGYGSPGAARFGAKFSMEPIVRASIVHMSKFGSVMRALTTKPHSITD